ncbi:MAG: NADH-ubiquinone oxidoreductase-F iron-sulfur binding region domain-containing protein [Nitriliruptoraceae bacterium]
MDDANALTGTYGWLLPQRPVTSLEAYIDGGGGRAWDRARNTEPDEIIVTVADAGLRGRGGGGFPTGDKWRSVRDASEETASAPHLVINGAEGEPGTAKDRLLLGNNPFQVLEGALVARHAVGADTVHIGVKAASGLAPSLRQAVDEIVAAGWSQPDSIEVVDGPDEYLFGEETALLEVLEGNLPLPRWLPPYQQGLHRSTGQQHPTVVNNVETLANVPVILTRGVDGYRAVGTADSPGTILCTVIGDVAAPGVYELPMGTPLRQLLVDVAGARDVKLVCNGAASPVLGSDELDVPLTYEDLRAAGSALGSAGFIVYNDRHCAVRIAITLSHFLAIESCGQCTACKLGCAAITDLLRTLDDGAATRATLVALTDRLPGITDQVRCALPNGEQLLVGSMLERFADEFAAHLEHPCPSSLVEPVPKIVALDDTTGEVRLDTEYHRKRADWSYAPA